MPLKTYAVIVAGGTGSRMGHDTPKQLLELEGKPILLHTLNTFLSIQPEIEIVLVIHPDYLERVRMILTELSHPIVLVPGGLTRFQSVKAGLAHVTDDSLVLIHDAVRCLVTPRLISSCLEHALAHGNAVPAVVPRESIRLIDQTTNTMIDRTRVRLIQTPQTFHASQIKEAYQSAVTDEFTDDASVLEAAGYSIHLVEGESSNIKITWPMDLQVAQAIIRDRNTPG